MLLQGNPSNKDTLKTGQIERAFSAIILSERQDGHSSQDTDAKSILVALALNVCNPNLHTTIELQNPDNIEHAQNAGANDFITATAYQGALLAQSASSPGVAKRFCKDLHRSGNLYSLCSRSRTIDWTELFICRAVLCYEANGSHLRSVSE